jgi:hypothetical protein
MPHANQDTWLELPRHMQQQCDVGKMAQNKGVVGAVNLSAG